MNNNPLKISQIMKRIYLYIIMLGMIALVSCNQRPSGQADASMLLKADREFSDYSLKFGMNKAFIEYADTAAVLLRSNNKPLEGKEKVMSFYLAAPDSAFTLKWEPLHAIIASSGELGYTYGTYVITPRDTLAGKKPSYGNYVTIWKKQANGGWKYILDTGNEGLGK
jgi:ketosteroid isomerase-like protein